LAKNKKEDTTQKTDFLKKLATPPKTPPKPIEKALRDKAIKHLQSLEHHEEMPWFCLKDVEIKDKNTYAHLFIAKWNRNAYGGLFVNFNPSKKPLSNDKKRWALSFRKKGYACVSVKDSEEFRVLVRDYYHSVGQSGKQHFNIRWERDI